MSLMHPMMMLIMFIQDLLIIWVGAHQVDMGVIQVGDGDGRQQHAMLL